MVDTQKFPFEVMRKEQEYVIDELNLHDKCKNFIISAATGSGKSALGISVIRSARNGFYIVSTKQLQDQLVSDFSNASFTSIKGKANYPCKLNPIANCECGPCLIRKDIKAKCIAEKKCQYYNLREEALSSNVFCTSYKFLFRAIDCAGWVLERDVMVFDEAHLLENELVDFAQLNLDHNELTQRWDLLSDATDVQKLELGTLPKPNDASIQNWIDTLAQLVNRQYSGLKSQFEAVVASGSEQEIKKAHSEFYEFDKIYRKLQNYSANKNKRWLFEVKADSVVLTPLDVNWIFAKYIQPYAKKFVFMSGTIFDPKCFSDTLGLDFNQTAYISADSSFDPKKSPVYILGNCKTNYQDLQDKANMDSIVQTIDKILAMYPDSKGLIHSGNFNITKYLKDHCKNARMLYRHEKDTNDVILQKHRLLKAPTVLVSSSMYEGVDLVDDLSRFMVIIKMPWLSLADKRIKKLSEINSNWYQVRVWERIVQAAGRSTRSETDYADTYILDNKFQFWWKQATAKNWIPQYFIDRVKKI